MTNGYKLNSDVDVDAAVFFSLFRESSETFGDENAIERGSLKRWSNQFQLDNPHMRRAR